jgi:hypothetical protein
MTENEFDTLSIMENGEKKLFRVRLKVNYAESGESRYCRLAEARTWDWNNQEIWRVISGWQITSYNKLLAMLVQKAQKGEQEIEMLEAPRFMMLAGG